MPAPNAFTGFTTTGYSSSPTKVVDNSPTTFNAFKGWEIWTDDSHTTSFYMPAAGYRAYDNGLAIATLGVRGYYWTSALAYNGRGIRLHFEASVINPVDHRNNGFGHSVRPVADN